MKRFFIIFHHYSSSYDEMMMVGLWSSPYGVLGEDYKRIMHSGSLTRNLKITVLTSICRIHQGRYGVYVPALHKKPQRYKVQYACMARSFTKELLTPFKDPKQEFRSSRKLFKTLSLDDLRSPEYNLKELRDNNLSGSDHEDANEHIRKTRSTETSDGLAIIQEQINNLRREIKKVNEMVYAAQVGYEQCKGPHYTKDYLLKEEGASIKTLEIQIGQMSKVLQERGFESLPSSTETNPRDYVKSISTTVEADMTPIRRIGSSQYAVSAQKNNKLMFESRRTNIPFPCHLNNYYCDKKKGLYRLPCLDAYSYGATRVDDSLPRKEKDPRSFTLPCYINNVCFENALADLEASVSVIPLSSYLNLGLGELAHTKLIVELANKTMKHPKGVAENVLVGIGKFVFLAKIDVFKRKITLRVGNEKIIFKSMKPASSLIKKVYMLSLRERVELDLEARLMGETLVLNRSLNPLYRDYIELNDIYVPIELRRDQVDDLMPTIEEDEDKVEYKGKNVVGALMNVPIFVGNFSVVTHFAVVENMDGYRGQDMGDVIFGEPFFKASCVEARRFDGLITIQNGNDNVTYQMARSHPRFKHLSNAQCNKIRALLKVSVNDKLNGISHPYQKLKSFYKGVLNLGPKYIQDAKMEEWLTRGHISVHEIETSLEKKSTKFVKYQSSGILSVL
ncbi:retrovirus-related pol polyprotein from transposon TNT 1-94 [Tanacetum coccineum]